MLNVSMQSSIVSTAPSTAAGRCHEAPSFPVKHVTTFFSFKMMGGK
jgi:hypothetical protein